MARRRIPDDVREKIAEAYPAKNTRELSREYKISVQGVCNVLREAGVALRKRGRQPKDG